jgi:hypothetical protein
VSFGQFPVPCLLAAGRVLEVRMADRVPIALALFTLRRLPLTVNLPLLLTVYLPLLLTVYLPLLLPVVLLVVRHGGRSGENHGQEDRNRQEISQERA